MRELNDYEKTLIYNALCDKQNDLVKAVNECTAYFVHTEDKGPLNLFTKDLDIVQSLLEEFI